MPYCKVLLARSNSKRIQNTRLPKSLADEAGCVMPLGIASIAAYLKDKGVAVSIIDAEAENLSLEKLEEKIFEIKPSIVGITCMTPTIHNDIAVAKIAKKAGATVVMGGPQLNAMPEETLQLPCVDIGIRGEGEYPMYKLVEAVSNNLALDNIPGIVYKAANKQILMNPAYLHQDLDLLPVPARDILPYKRYFSIISKGRLTTICPGRGCPFTCGFCFKQPQDSKIRYRSPKLVVDEIEEVINRYGINEINFVSDTLTSNRNFIVGLCQEMIDRKIKLPWIAPTRVDCITLDLLKLMKKAGCRSLRFGVESGSVRILKLMNKDIDKKQMLQVFKWAKSEKIESFAYLIIGYISETEATIKETLAFVKELKPDLLMYNIATPLPCTQLFDQAVEAKLVEPDYWKKFVLDENYPRIPYLFKDTEEWISRAYREFYFSPHFLFRKILELKSGNLWNYIKAVRGILNFKA